MSEVQYLQADIVDIERRLKNLRASIAKQSKSRYMPGQQYRGSASQEMDRHYVRTLMAKRDNVKRRLATAKRIARKR